LGHRLENISFQPHPSQAEARVARLPIQRKLTIGQPNDTYEQEADRVASQVVDTLQKQSAPGEEEELQMKPESVQRQSASEEEELQMKAAESVGGGEASEDLESVIQGARGSGQNLDDSVRDPIEQAMGADFSRVKIHTDTQSDQLNRSLHSRAFTTGNDVFFKQGEYNPQSQSGQELLAHELTHVVQQGAASSQPVQRQVDNVIQRDVLGDWQQRGRKQVSNEFSNQDDITAITLFVESLRQAVQKNKANVLRRAPKEFQKLLSSLGSGAKKSKFLQQLAAEVAALSVQEDSDELEFEDTAESAPRAAKQQPVRRM
jgi:hypothetical protein